MLNLWHWLSLIVVSSLVINGLAAHMSSEIHARTPGRARKSKNKPFQPLPLLSPLNVIAGKEIYREYAVQGSYQGRENLRLRTFRVQDKSFHDEIRSAQAAGVYVADGLVVSLNNKPAVLVEGPQNIQTPTAIQG
ncbi:hypothetical protein BDP27DRAFT_1339262 [Rhodocollybia butyracea]|uniref:Uncharacterized protein n=1 Tax=Rhodocollybia butyracea TaxID=206335 RepID=A0A9P5PBZ9_9AGAR|nr:hypothetical protein BDP27DRAFT_1339262 [Rhodocollybia butyracea]